jgi:RNA polymerase sigma factor (sigma-70 family)
MSATGASDCTLVSAYAAEGSEPAFRALVQRHVDLVYATALRQLGDSGWAEEVSQNVFVVLARKAPRLAGIETLAGWLHRTTVLEAKARIRSELRRRRREDAAAQFATLQREGASPLDALIPLLDEALLSLREGDRFALVLRFLEERSLRDVGTVLGVDEDAARKRVSRALERLSGFFRQKGFTVAVGGSAALFAHATHAAPAGLAIAAANAGVAAGGAATGLNLIWVQLMNLTKTQAGVVCALVVAGPLAWQWHAEARLAREQSGVRSQIAAASATAADLEDNLRRTRENLLRATNATAQTEARLSVLNTQLEKASSLATYHWDDSSPLVRVPKRVLDTIPISTVSNKRGQITDQIKEVLQLTGAEAQFVQGAIDRFAADYQSLEAGAMKRVEPISKDLQGHEPDQTRVFEVPGLMEQVSSLRQTLFDQLQSALGDERFQILQRGLDSWMPLDDNQGGIGSLMAVFNFDHRMRFYEPKPGDQSLNYSVENVNGSAVWATMPLEDIPQVFQPQLQDWLALARSKPAPATGAFGKSQ